MPDNDLPPSNQTNPANEFEAVSPPPQTQSADELFGDIKPDKPKHEIYTGDNRSGNDLPPLPQNVPRIPMPIAIESLGRDEKTFMVAGDTLDGDSKATLMKVVPGLNMGGYNLRTQSVPKTEYGIFFENAAVAKEIYLPWKDWNKQVTSIIAKTDPAAFDMACWTATHIFKNKTAEDFNEYKPGFKIRMANDMYLLLGKDFNTKVGFIIIDSKCGSVRFTRDTDYDNLSFDASMVLRYSKLFNIKVFNIRNQDSMRELELLLNL